MDRTELSFKNGGFEYTVYSYYDGEEKPAKEETGVWVNKTSLGCAGPTVNNLYSLKEIVSCDENNSLGGCK